VSDAALKQFVELAGGAKARLVVLPPGTGPGAEPSGRLLHATKDPPESVAVLRLPARAGTDPAEFLEPLRQATGAWLDGDDPARLVGAELRELLRRGGVIGGSARAACGLGLLPGTVLDARDGELDKNPALFGLSLEAGAVLVVRGREMRTLGPGRVTTHLGRSPGREPRTIELKGRAGADLTALRRAAVARSQPPFPPKEPPAPEVPSGSLVIVGGGGMPAEVTSKFIELAGGPDALIVVLPTANPDPLPANADAGFLGRAGARNVKVLRARELKDVEAPESLALMKQAKGVWFGGGRQWRFVDAYEGTQLLELMRDVLRRGGVIGGSSAGATIQGDYLCRGSPLGNLEIMYEGYERGLGFLPGVAIDQHFTQRKRFPDMTALMKTYPQLLGIGIDEGTALIVRGHVAEVLGRTQAHFYDRRKPVVDGQPDYEVVKSGGRYDLKARKVLPSDEKGGQ
jgi:cyanophycinase